jgi:hypothetical protein
MFKLPLFTVQKRFIQSPDNKAKPSTEKLASTFFGTNQKFRFQAGAEDAVRELERNVGPRIRRSRWTGVDDRGPML